MASTRKKDGNCGQTKTMLLQTLEDLVSVNALFTAAVFLGISFAAPNQRSLETHRRECDPDNKMGKRLVVCEVVSFASFLLSSLLAKSLKVFITLYCYDKTPPESGEQNVESNYFDLKRGLLFRSFTGLMFALSMLASTIGVLFLTISMAYVVEIKIGRLSCKVSETYAAVMALTVLVAFGLLIYLPSMLTVLVYCIKKN